MKYSIEKLVHFQCEVIDCKKWFSIGDAPLDRFYFCPWCGNQTGRMAVVEPLTMDDMYGDGSKHQVCEKCGMCKHCGDCKCAPNAELSRALGAPNETADGKASA